MTTRGENTIFTLKLCIYFNRGGDLQYTRSKFFIPGKISYSYYMYANTLTS